MIVPVEGFEKSWRLHVGGCLVGRMALETKIYTLPGCLSKRNARMALVALPTPSPPAPEVSSWAGRDFAALQLRCQLAT